ncbi:MAG: hypothetical protein GY702_04220, partial [Desulfobulbaceae bacterium]|nr:hypothetical protein [Desulfobulbaceae bacterium]
MMVTFQVPGKLRPRRVWEALKTLMNGGSGNIKSLLKSNLEKLFAVIDYLQAYQMWYTLIDYAVKSKYGQVARLKKLYQAIYLTHENHPMSKKVFDYTFIALDAKWMAGDIPFNASPNQYSRLIRVLRAIPRIKDQILGEMKCDCCGRSIVFCVEYERTFKGIVILPC